MIEWKKNWFFCTWTKIGSPPSKSRRFVFCCSKLSECKYIDIINWIIWFFGTWTKNGSPPRKRVSTLVLSSVLIVLTPLSCVHICVYMYMWMCIFLYECVVVLARTQQCTRTHIQKTHNPVVLKPLRCVYVSACLSMLTRLHTRTHAHLHKFTFTHIQTWTHHESGAPEARAQVQHTATHCDTLRHTATHCNMYIYL